MGTKNSIVGSRTGAVNAEKLRSSRRESPRGLLKHMRQGRKRTFTARSPGPDAARQAAEKRRTAKEYLGEAPAGAKAPPLFWGFCGTTKVVPFHDGFDLNHYPGLQSLSRTGQA